MQYTNEYRRDHGCPDLKLNDQLTEAAQQHSENMATNDFFRIPPRMAQPPWDRIEAAALHSPWLPKTSLPAQRTPKETVEGWYNSEGHRENMLNCELNISEWDITTWKMTLAKSTSTPIGRRYSLRREVFLQTRQPLLGGGASIYTQRKRVSVGRSCLTDTLLLLVERPKHYLQLHIAVRNGCRWSST